MTGIRRNATRFMLGFESAALYVTVFTLPLQALVVVPVVEITVTKASGALLIGSVVLRRLGTRHFPFKRTGLELGMALFAISCLLSLIGSIDRAGSLNALATLCTYVVLLYAVAEVSARKEIQHRVVTVFVVAASLCGLGGILAAMGLVSTQALDLHLQVQDVKRVAYGLADANEQALLLLFALCFLVFYKGMWDGRRMSVFSLMASLLTMCGIMLTMSRTAWACGLGMAAFRMATSKRRLRLSISVAVVVSVVLISLAIAQPRFFGDAGRRTFAAITLADSSETHRIFQYVAAAERSWDRGIFGHGLATRDAVSATLYYRNGMPMKGTVHSVPLIFLLELGWFGVVSYLLLWSSLFVVLREAYGRASPGVDRSLILSYLAVFASLGMFSMVMPFIYRSSFPVLIGCAIGAVRIVGEAPSDCVRESKC